MIIISKVVFLMSLVTLVHTGVDPEQFLQASKNMKNDYKGLAITVKDYVNGDTNQDILEDVNNISKDMDDLVESYDFDRSKEKISEYFITLTDFIFNDKEIKGVKFNDLKEIEKQMVLDLYNKIDQKIESKFPSYKEEVSEKVEVVKEKTNDLKEYTNELIEEKIGEENYNEIKETVSETKEKVKETVRENYNKAKTKITEWYTEYKNKKES